MRSTTSDMIGGRVAWDMIFVENIAAGPAERRRQGQHKAHQWDMLPAEAPLHQHQHAEDRQRDPRQLLAL